MNLLTVFFKTNIKTYPILIAPQSRPNLFDLLGYSQYILCVVCSQRSIIINQQTMQGEDLQAGNSLRSLSQRTSYIIDWNQPSAASPSRRYREQIPEEHDDFAELPSIRRKRAIQKETSEKYDLKKYEKKLQTIDRDEPVSPTQRASEGKKSKLGEGEAKATPSSGIFQRKQSKSVPWLRPVEAEYLRRQVQVQRKNSDSQKDLQARLAIQRQRNAVLVLNAKRSQQEEKRGRVAVSEQDIEQIKRIIARGAQRSSLAYLLQEECLPAIRALH